MVCSIATRAFLPPRRAASRLYLEARKVPRVAAIDSAAGWSPPTPPASPARKADDLARRGSRSWSRPKSGPFLLSDADPRHRPGHTPWRPFSTHPSQRIGGGSPPSASPFNSAYRGVRRGEGQEGSKSDAGAQGNKSTVLVETLRTMLTNRLTGTTEATAGSATNIPIPNPAPGRTQGRNLPDHHPRAKPRPAAD